MRNSSIEAGRNGSTGTNERPITARFVAIKRQSRSRRIDDDRDVGGEIRPSAFPVDCPATWVVLADAPMLSAVARAGWRGIDFVGSAIGAEVEQTRPEWTRVEGYPGFD